MLELANHEGVHRFSLAILDELSKPNLNVCANVIGLRLAVFHCYFSFLS